MYERPAGLPDWAHWRTIANVALSELTTWSGQTSDVRIWPHHFDTGVYYAQTDTERHEKAAIWAGYAVADSLCNEPYFYLSGYWRGQAINFTAAPALSVGEWRNASNWKRALLPVSSAGKEAGITLFFQESYRWLEKATTDPLSQVW